jgi:hypothetical protein
MTISRLWTWLGKKRWWFFLALIAAGAPLAIFVLPSVLARSHGPISEPDRLAAENAVRGTLIQALGGVVLFAGLYITWRSFDLNRQGQVTERFTRAIDQLGNKQPDVRTGGIYALERIARDSERDQGPIVEVLIAYVRSHAPWPPQETEEVLVPKSRRRPPPDVQAALRVLGRRDPGRDEKGLRLRLSDVDLRGANLRGGRLEGARFRRSNLEGAHLEGAQLQGAKFRKANLHKADLASAPDLGLSGANLAGADLKGANLESAKLEGVNLNGAICDERTRWPEGFDHEKAGVLVSNQT